LHPALANRTAFRKFSLIDLFQGQIRISFSGSGIGAGMDIFYPMVRELIDSEFLPSNDA
jgi:hypothetical protein